MKKIALVLFTAVLFVAFTACSGSKKEEAPEAPAVVEEVVEEAPVVEINPVDALKAFQEYTKEYVEAFNNLTKDPQKFATISGQLKEKLTEMEHLKENFTPAQLKQYEKAKGFIIQANNAGKK